MIRALRLLALSGWYGYRALFSWNSPGLFVTVLVLTPLLQTVFFVLLGRSLDYQSADFFVLGNGVQVAAAAGIGGLISVIANERQFGTLGHLLASPSPKAIVFLGRVIPGVVLGVAVSVLTIAVGMSVAGEASKLALIPLWLLPIFAVSFSSAALGLALSALGLVYRDIYQIATAAGLLLLVVSGANLDRRGLPTPLFYLGSVLPQANGVDAAREIAINGWSESAAISVLLEMCVGLVWLLLAVFGVSWMARRARIHATLDLY